MNRRNFLSLAGSCCALSAVDASAAAPAGLSLPVAINKSGRQRMLSQRCAKAWLMQAQAVLPERAPGILVTSVALFEKQLGELKTLLPSEELRVPCLQLEREWAAYHPVLADPRSDPKALWSANEAVLAAAQKLTLAYEKTAGSPAGHLVNLSGRQRMLSQRMAKAYFFHQMGVNGAQAGDMLTASMKEFAVAHEVLKATPKNSAQIVAELALVEQQWLFFQAALGDGGEPKRAANAVATTSERILEQMDLVVGLYERLARDADA